MYFSFDFGWYSIYLDIFHPLRTKEGGVGRVCVTDKIREASVTKVICQQSPTPKWFRN